MLEAAMARRATLSFFMLDSLSVMGPRTGPPRSLVGRGRAAYIRQMAYWTMIWPIVRVLTAAERVISVIR